MYQSAAPNKVQGAEGPEAVSVETRFGCFDFTPANRFEFPQGLVGFSQLRQFGLGNFPDPNLADFNLLQSIDDTSLTFIVHPLPLEGGPIASADVEECFNACNVSLAHGHLVSIVTIQPTGNGIQLSINLRAPILLDISRMRGRQLVLANNEYPVRCLLQRKLNN